ncbi:MAG TPA: cytochrome P450 [Streptosporangiaceae bacterium]|jgi:cytochrome P450
MQENAPATPASLAERFANDPYRVYAELRQGAPVYRATLPDGSAAWIVTRYADVRSALADGRLTKDPRVAAQAMACRRNETAALGESGSPLEDNMLCVDPPRHTRLRKLINGAFTSGRVEALRPRVQQIADQLLDVIAPRGGADLIAEFATPLPVAVICELIGIPGIDHEKFRGWLTDLAGITVTAVTETAQRAQREVAGYLGQQIDRKREAPGDDLLSALLSARADDGSTLSGSELVSMLYLLLTAGHETTANLIGSGVYALLRHPDQLELLREQPGLLPSAIEEFLRYESPFNVASARFTVEATQIGGVTIPAGEAVLPAIGSANRDPGQFPDPDRLEIRRPAGGNLVFGHGVHYCAGAPLARLEGEVAFGALLHRLSGLRLAVPAGQLRWQRPCFLIRGLSELPVRFTPQPGPQEDGR